MKPKSKILTIAGSDSGGGAGIQADVKTITSLGSYAFTAVTAITAQNTKGVKSIMHVSKKIFNDQLELVLDDIRPDVIKIGMIGDLNKVSILISKIKKFRLKKIVLDPVMVAKGGAKLMNRPTMNLLKKKLIPLVEIVTPNLPEAEILAGFKIKNELDMIKAGEIILSKGAKNVLLKGGHLNSSKIINIFINKKRMRKFINKRVNTKNTHGTGCTLSSAIATYYSQNKNILKSIKMSLDYVHEAVLTATNIGKGHGPINHLNSILINKRFR